MNAQAIGAEYAGYFRRTASETVIVVDINGRFVEEYAAVAVDGAGARSTALTDNAGIQRTIATTEERVDRVTGKAHLGRVVGRTAVRRVLEYIWNGGLHLASDDGRRHAFVRVTIEVVVI